MNVFNLKRLVEIGVTAALGQAEKKLGSLGMAEAIPDMVSQGMNHFGLPETIDLPLHIQLFGKLALASYQRNQQIQESHRRVREEANNANNATGS